MILYYIIIYRLSAVLPEQTDYGANARVKETAERERARAAVLFIVTTYIILLL